MTLIVEIWCRAPSMGRDQSSHQSTGMGLQQVQVQPTRPRSRRPACAIVMPGLGGLLAVSEM